MVPLPDDAECRGRVSSIAGSRSRSCKYRRCEAKDEHREDEERQERSATQHCRWFGTTANDPDRGGADETSGSCEPIEQSEASSGPGCGELYRDEYTDHRRAERGPERVTAGHLSMMTQGVNYPGPESQGNGRKHRESTRRTPAPCLASVRWSGDPA